MNNRRWLYVFPVFGAAFGLWYVKNAFVDVVYSDYIRLVNSYLPDVWDPRRFLVGDILTRIPLNYIARIINTTFFDYRIRFDQVLGVLSLGLAAALIVSYCIKKEISLGWTLCLMAVNFSLNKWEMMINGSGWIHFLAFAGFYYHYLVLERLWTGQEKKGDRMRCLLLPWVLTLAVAGPYCAVYTAVLGLAYGFRLLAAWRRERRWDLQYICYGISALIPLLLYVWSNAQVTEKVGVVVDVPFWRQFLDTPGYMIRFFVKSFASMAVGGECAQAAFSSDLPYLVLGAVVMAGYGLALWFWVRFRLWEETLFPLLLTGAGLLNHLLVWYSRWVFMNEEYGMSSRYALQFQVGILGIFLTFALVRKRPAVKGAGRLRRAAARAMIIATGAVLLAGNGYTTIEEIKKAPFRKEACQRRAEIALDFENRTDEELAANFEYRPSRPESGRAVRSALEILKKNKWNVFRD